MTVNTAYATFGLSKRFSNMVELVRLYSKREAEAARLRLVLSWDSYTEATRRAENVIGVSASTA